MEVAQLALPVFLSRAEAILRRYAAEDRRDEQAGGNSLSGLGDAASATANARSLQPLTDKARHVAELVRQLWVSPAVVNACLLAMEARGSQLKPWVDVARARRKRSPGSQPGSAGGAGQTLPQQQPLGSGGVIEGGTSWPLGSSMLSSISRSTGSGASSAAPPVAAVRKEQTHLLALYGALCVCAGGRDAVVREASCAMLSQIGRDIGLVDSHAALPPSSFEDA